MSDLTHFDDSGACRMVDVGEKPITRRVAVADLSEDGACTNCYGVVPLQVQNEIRHGTALIRCEACGVILSAPDPEEEKKPEGEGDAEAGANDAEAGDESPTAEASEDVEEETPAEA